MYIHFVFHRIVKRLSFGRDLLLPPVYTVLSCHFMYSPPSPVAGSHSWRARQGMAVYCTYWLVRLSACGATESCFGAIKLEYVPYHGRMDTCTSIFVFRIHLQIKSTNHTQITKQTTGPHARLLGLIRIRRLIDPANHKRQRLPPGNTSPNQAIVLFRSLFLARMADRPGETVHVYDQGGEDCITRITIPLATLVFQTPSPIATDHTQGKGATSVERGQLRAAVESI